MVVLSGRIRRYGIPRSLYRDHKNAFVTETANRTLRSNQLGLPPRVTSGLPAGNRASRRTVCGPRGGAERSRAACQDRFVKEPRIAGIPAIGADNKFPAETCLPKISAKFSRPPAKSGNAHVPLLNASLREIMCFGEARTFTATWW